MVKINSDEVVYDGVLIFPNDQSGADLYLFYGGVARKLLLSFSSNFNGQAGVWVHNHLQHKYTSILFAKWGSAGDNETILNPPVRFCDLDGQRFEITVAHRKIGEAHRAAVQITAVAKNYGGPYTPALYGSDQPAELKIP